MVYFMTTKYIIIYYWVTNMSQMMIGKAIILIYIIYTCYDTVQL